MAALVAFAGMPEAWFRWVAATAAVTAVAVGLSGTYVPVPHAAARAAETALASEKASGLTAPRGPQGDLVAPDPVSAQVNARRANERVEDVSQRTANSSTFALPDGNWELAQAPGQVWVRLDGDGSQTQDWAAVDATLQKSDANGVAWFAPVAPGG